MSLATLRKRLAKPQTSWQLSILGLLGGVVAALVIVLFRLLIEYIQSWYLMKPDNYTTLGDVSRFNLPILGAIVILCFAAITGFKYNRMGIPFVLHRLKTAYGLIPFRNTLNQFFGSAVALATGFSVGREGPAVHLGAASSSFIGRILSLPNNSIRTLCACGVAAGISASFNTPIAAVIFVMEVILREYKIHIFIPVMLAAVVGSMITNAIFGPVHEFEFFTTIALDYWHYPLLILFGMAMGVLASLFNRYIMIVIRFFDDLHIVARLLLAACITGALGFAVPFSMGTGISAIAFSLSHNTELLLLVSLLAAKFLATVFAIGLGIPGGIIGPILGIGAVAGVLASIGVNLLLPGTNLASDFALLGMAGMMAAALHAPLAALLAIVELSNQLDVIVPAMIVVSSAYIVSGQFLKNHSIFLRQLNFQELDYHVPPIEGALQKIGVLAKMNEQFQVLQDASEQQIKECLANMPITHACIVKNLNSDTEFSLAQFDLSLHPNSTNMVNLIAMQGLDKQATLAEAYNLLVDARQGAVYIFDTKPNEIIGILSFEQIRSELFKRKLNE